MSDSTGITFQKPVSKPQVNITKPVLKKKESVISGRPNEWVKTTFPPVISLPAKKIPPGTDVNARKVALLLPLSGPRELLGQELLDAAQIAMFDLANENFIIFPFDTKGTVPGAAVAANKAIDAGVELILGPLLASSVRAVRPIAVRADVPVVAFSNSREIAGDGIFILGFVPRQQVEAIVHHSVSKGLARFAVFAPQNAYGRAVVAAFRTAVEARGAKIVEVDYYDPRTTDFSSKVRKIADFDFRHNALKSQKSSLKLRNDEISQQALKRLGKLDTLGEVAFDAILLPASGQQLKTIASLLSYYDVDQPAVRFLGLSNWAQTANIESEPSLNLGWYAAPPRAERHNFLLRYRKLFGRPPPAIASLAYDATALAIVLAQTNTAQYFAHNRLIQPYGFLGVDGLFRLQPAGVAERVFEIREVTRKGFKIIRSAATSFSKLELTSPNSKVVQ